MVREAAQRIHRIDRELWDLDAYFAPEYTEPDWRRVVGLLKEALGLSASPDVEPGMLRGIVEVAGMFAEYPRKEDWTQDRAEAGNPIGATNPEYPARDSAGDGEC